MVVLDATFLMLFFRPDVPFPTGAGGVPIDLARERIDCLIQQLEKSRSKIIVPTPVLSEILVRAGPSASQEIVEKLNRLAVFRIESFDARAAIEVAAMTRVAIAAGNKKGTATGPWAKIKYDRQIVAIAKVARATAIYSDDADIRKIAAVEDIAVVKLSELPIPDAARQGDLFKHQEVEIEPTPKPEPDDAETDR